MSTLRQETSIKPAESDQAICPSCNGLPARDRMIGIHLREQLKTHPEFNKEVLAANSPPPAFYFDAIYKEQLLGEARDLCIHLLQQGRAMDDAFREAIEQVVKWRPAYANFRKRCEGMRVIVMCGTARNGVIELIKEHGDGLERFTRHLARGAVPNGISVIDGASDTGAMGLVNRIWREEIEAWKAAGNECKSEVILVPLRFDPLACNITEPPSPHGSKGFRSPPLGTFLTRTPALFTVGQQLCHLFYPGGLGTTEEASRNLLEGQMREITSTFHERSLDMPTAYFLNAAFTIKRSGHKASQGFHNLARRIEPRRYEALKDSLSAGLQERTEHFYEPWKRFLQGQIKGLATSPKDLKHIRIRGLEKPEALAEAVLDECIYRMYYLDEKRKNPEAKVEPRFKLGMDVTPR